MLLNKLEMEAALESTDAILLTSATARVRKGHEIRLVISSPHPVETPTMRNERLVALLVEANAAADLVASSPGRTLNAIAAEHGRCRTHLGKLIALNGLAPDIVTAIIEEKQPPVLRKGQLLGIELPLSWSDQRAALGFTAL